MLALTVLLVLAAVGAGAGPPPSGPRVAARRAERGRWAHRDRGRRGRRCPVAAVPTVPAGRPLERVAADVRRLRALVVAERCGPHRGTSALRRQATRLAHVDVLAEACRCLGVEHALPRLQGVERDLEVLRVEAALAVRGLCPWPDPVAGPSGPASSV